MDAFEWIKMRGVWLDVLIALPDADRLSVLQAMKAVMSGGEIPEMSITARIAWMNILPVLESDKEQRDKITEARKEAGAKGGRPKNQNNQMVLDEKQKNQMVSEEKQKNQMVFEEKQKKQKVAKKKEERREEDIRSSSSSVGSSFITDEEAEQMMQMQTEIINEAEKVGLDATDWNREKLVDAVSVYGKDAVMDALHDAADHGAVKWVYIQRILDNQGQSRASPEDRPWNFVC